MAGRSKTKCTQQKVCLILHQIAGRSGGAERVIVETANAIAARGHRVEILTHERNLSPPFFPLNFGVSHTNLRRPDAVRSDVRQRFDRWREKKHNLRRHKFSPFGRLVWVSRNGAFWRRLESYINCHQPDVAIAFLPPAIVALGMIRPGYSLRRIASLHNVPERDLCDPARWDPNPIDRKRRMSSLRQHDAITVLQPEFRAWFTEEMQKKISIVPNVVRQMSVSRVARHRRHKTVVSIGRLATVKRHDMLIDAWSRIVGEFPDWKLKIFGRGPLATELKEQISMLSLSDHVRLMGHTKRIDDEYLSASIVAHPAEHEGWGLAASEGLAAGVPVVGFVSCPGINHLVKHEVNGLLIPEGSENADALADSLATLMRDNEKREKLASAAQDSVRQYEPTKVYDLWEDLLYGD